MKHFHRISFRWIVKEEGSADALRELIGFDEKTAIIEEERATGLSDNEIVILRASLLKDGLCNQFVQRITESLSEEQFTLLVDTLDSRLDDELFFFLRFDKQKWMNEKALVLTDSGDCIHLTFSVAAFPKKREVAVELLKEIFKR